MATQGLVSVVQDGKTIVKAVCGINGMKAPMLAAEIRSRKLVDAKSIFDAAKRVGFGEEASLVVLDRNQICFDGDGEVSELYTKTFDDPEFNPRWECGIPDRLEIVEL